MAWTTWAPARAHLDVGGLGPGVQDEHAQAVHQVELLSITDQDTSWSLRWEPGDTQQQRMALIDMQTHVADELKRRGLQPYVGVERLADGIECYMVSLPDDEDDDD